MKRLWAVDELIEHWTLLPGDLALLANKAGATRLGFAVLLKAFQLDARFPEHKGEVPTAVVAHLAKQAGVPTAAWLAYDWRGRASEYHRAQIRETLGFRPATVDDAEGLARWLAAEVAPREDRPDAHAWRGRALYAGRPARGPARPAQGRCLRALPGAPPRTPDTRARRAARPLGLAGVRGRLLRRRTRPPPADRPRSAGCPAR